jgi:uncharacterized protein
MRRILLALGLCLAGPALAQAPAKPPAPAAAPDAATLKVARDVVGKMQGDRAQVLASMSGPMVGLMQQMGVREPDRAQALVQEVVLPVLTAHYDELLDVQARSFATVLGGADLQAVSAFYDTPAGKALAKAQPQLAQVQLTGMTQWMGGLVPEIQGKAVQAVKAHGWDKAPGQSR